MSTPTSYADQVTGAKVSLTKADGSEIEIQNWKRITHKSGYFKVIADDAAATETDYEIVVAPTVQQPASIQYGVMIANGDNSLSASQVIQNNETTLRNVGLKLIRVPVFFGQSTLNKSIDTYLQAGFNVQINFNYLPTTTPVDFPADSAMIRTRAESFFQYYQQWIKQIPVVVIENEWDNKNYRKTLDSNAVKAYCNEAAIITDVAHKYGFKVADAGITSNGIRGWYYSILSPSAQTEWASRYLTGKNSPDFNSYCAIVDSYCQQAINIPFDYSCIHWYNRDTCNNGFAECSKAFGLACGKQHIITNEFGIFTASLDLFKQTAAEIKQIAEIMIAYSGVNAPGDAVKLSDDMLKALQ